MSNKYSNNRIHATWALFKIWPWNIFSIVSNWPKIMVSFLCWKMQAQCKLSCSKSEVNKSGFYGASWWLSPSSSQAIWTQSAEVIESSVLVTTIWWGMKMTKLQNVWENTILIQFLLCHWIHKEWQLGIILFKKGFPILMEAPWQSVMLQVAAQWGRKGILIS